MNYTKGIAFDLYGMGSNRLNALVKVFETRSADLSANGNQRADS